MLELFNEDLAVLAVIAFYHFDGVCVVADEVIVHAFLVGAAEDGSD